MTFSPTDTHQSRSSKFGRALVIVAALVGGWYLFDYARLKAENDPWAVGILLGLVALSAYGYFSWQARESERARAAEAQRLRDEGKDRDIAFDDPRFKPNRAWLAPIVIVLVLCVWGASAGITSRDNYIRPYCLYGAQSSAQLDGCMSHVTSDEINDRDTQAARFARGETSECFEDAGPYCAGASRWNTIEPDPSY